MFSLRKSIRQSGDRHQEKTSTNFWGCLANTFGDIYKNFTIKTKQATQELEDKQFTSQIKRRPRLEINFKAP